MSRATLGKIYRGLWNRQRAISFVYIAIFDLGFDCDVTVVTGYYTGIILLLFE